LEPGRRAGGIAVLGADLLLYSGRFVLNLEAC
jgi:hypothetical protein